MNDILITLLGIIGIIAVVKVFMYTWIKHYPFEDNTSG